METRWLFESYGLWPIGHAVEMMIRAFIASEADDWPAALHSVAMENPVGIDGYRVTYFFQKWHVVMGITVEPAAM